MILEHKVIQTYIHFILTWNSFFLIIVAKDAFHVAAVLESRANLVPRSCCFLNE